MRSRKGLGIKTSVLRHGWETARACGAALNTAGRFGAGVRDLSYPLRKMPADGRQPASKTGGARKGRVRLPHLPLWRVNRPRGRAWLLTNAAAQAAGVRALRSPLLRLARRPPPSNLVEAHARRDSAALTWSIVRVLPHPRDSHSLCLPKVHGAGVEPARPFGHVGLNDARLPVPPSMRTSCARGDSNPHALRHHHLKVARLPSPPRARTGHGSRTRLASFKDSLASEATRSAQERSRTFTGSRPAAFETAVTTVSPPARRR